jgi:hypothetical protein
LAQLVAQYVWAARRLAEAPRVRRKLEKRAVRCIRAAMAGLDVERAREAVAGQFDWPADPDDDLLADLFKELAAFLGGAGSGFAVEGPAYRRVRRPDNVVEEAEDDEE